MFTYNSGNVLNLVFLNIPITEVIITVALYYISDYETLKITVLIIKNFN